MKHLILASIFCLTCTLYAQTPVVPQIIHPPYITPSNIGVWPVVQGIQNSHKTHELLAPREVLRARALNLMKGFEAPGGVCSVPLLEAHADANDPGIATTLRDHSVPIPQAHLPAPPCKKE
jgi:hypothetical protein